MLLTSLIETSNLKPAIAYNLLNNAIKFTHNGGKIQLIVEPVSENKQQKANNKEKEQNLPIFNASQWIRFSVIDNGIGIAEADLEKLFQPFVQIDSSLNRQYNGTGLGLFLVNKLVELHGGKITVRSEVDHGISFRVDIPYREEVVVKSHVLPKETHNQKSIVSTTTNHAHKNYSAIILFSDDTQANITTIFNYLEARGYRTILVKNDEECVNFTKKGNPDLILVDIPMSDIDKIETIKLLRADQQLQYIPIIAFYGLNVPSNSSDDTDNSDKQIYRDKCIAMGANEYFTKPVKLKILLAKIQDLLTQHSSLNMPH